MKLLLLILITIFSLNATMIIEFQPPNIPKLVKSINKIISADITQNVFIIEQINKNSSFKGTREYGDFLMKLDHYILATKDYELSFLSIKENLDKILKMEFSEISYKENNILGLICFLLTNSDKFLAKTELKSINKMYEIYVLSRFSYLEYQPQGFFRELLEIITLYVKKGEIKVANNICHKTLNQGIYFNDSFYNIVNKLIEIDGDNKLTNEKIRKYLKTQLWKNYENLNNHDFDLIIKLMVYLKHKNINIDTCIENLPFDFYYRYFRISNKRYIIGEELEKCELISDRIKNEYKKKKLQSDEKLQKDRKLYDQMLLRLGLCLSKPY